MSKIITDLYVDVYATLSNKDDIITINKNATAYLDLWVISGRPWDHDAAFAKFVKNVSAALIH